MWASWGEAWFLSWGPSWGYTVEEEEGGGGPPKKRRRGKLPRRWSDGPLVPVRPEVIIDHEEDDEDEAILIAISRLLH